MKASSLAFERHAIAFDRLRQVADFSAYEFAAVRSQRERSFPLLTREQAGHCSDSPFLDRQAAAELVARQNPELPAPPAGARYIIAGQQAGLLTGPLYTFLKAVTAIRLARDLSLAGDALVLPLFWIASEDHDVLEVNRVTVAGQRYVHPYAGSLARGDAPQVADIDLRAAQAPLLAFLQAALPPTEFTDWVCSLVAGADFTSYATAFRGLMHALFARWELRLIDPLALRPLSGPALAALVARWVELPAALAQGTERLRQADVAAPLADAGIYEIVAGRRVPVAIDAAGARLSSGICSLQEAARVIRERPEHFSPSAALRPICQDAALPVLATVGGPAELAYLLQIEPLYALAHATPSLRAPRVSATFLEPGIVRALAMARLEPADVFMVAGEDDHHGMDGAADPAGDAIRAKADALLAEIDRHAPQPEPRWLRKGREAIEAGAQRIIAELAEQREAARGRDRERMVKIRAAVLPGGKPQERVVNVTQFLNLHGPEFIECAIEDLDPWDARHQVVAIRTE